MHHEVTDQGHKASAWLQPGRWAPKRLFQTRVTSASLRDNYKQTPYCLLPQLCSPLVYIYYYLFSSLILITSLRGGCRLSSPFYRWENRSIGRSHGLPKVHSLCEWLNQTCANVAGCKAPIHSASQHCPCSPYLPSPCVTPKLSRELQLGQTGSISSLWPHVAIFVLLECPGKALGL